MPVNVKILIQAVDQASKVMQKVTGSVKQAETQMKSLGNISRNTGNTIQTGMDKSANGIKKAESATKNLQGSLNATAN